MSDRLWDISDARNYSVAVPGDITDAPADMVARLPDMVGALQFPVDRLWDSADQQGESVVHVRNMAGEVKTPVAYIGGSVDHVRKRAGDICEVVARLNPLFDHIGGCSGMSEMPVTALQLLASKLERRSRESRHRSNLEPKPLASL